MCPALKYHLFPGNRTGETDIWRSNIMAKFDAFQKNKADNWHRILAVHGLAADPIRTWVETKEEWNWLENQLVSIIPEARVWTFGYNSSWCGDKSVDTRLNEVAIKLLDTIIQKVFFHVERFFLIFEHI